MQNLCHDLSKKGLSTKKFHKITVKAFFINAINMQKNVICYFHATAAIKQTTTISINAFNN